MIAPPSTSSAGLILYCMRIRCGFQPSNGALGKGEQPANSSPMETGASPFCIEERHGQLSSLFQIRPTKNVSKAVGPKKTMTTRIAPKIPAAHSPIATIIIMFGPGTICATL